MIHIETTPAADCTDHGQSGPERRTVDQCVADHAKHREKGRDTLDGECLEAGVAVDVDIGAVMIETGDHEDHSEEKNESTDKAAEQEQLFDAVVRSKPFNHGLDPPPDVLYVCPGNGDYN